MILEFTCTNIKNMQSNIQEHSRTLTRHVILGFTLHSNMRFQGYAHHYNHKNKWIRDGEFEACKLGFQSLPSGGMEIWAVLPPSGQSLASQVLSSTSMSWSEVRIGFSEFGQSYDIKMVDLDQMGPRFGKVRIQESLQWWIWSWARIRARRTRFHSHFVYFDGVFTQIEIDQSLHQHYLTKHLILSTPLCLEIRAHL